MRVKIPLIDRWRAKVDVRGPDECWLWQGALYGSGYGTMRNEESEQEGAHRVSFRLHKGPIPKGMEILHARHCTSKRCVNPAHLRAGTHSENVQDMLALGTQNVARGERSGMAILTEELVLRIRNDVRSYMVIANELGLSPGTIYYAKSGRTWKHVGRTANAG